MGAEARQLELPRIDFSGVDPSAPGAGQWAAVRAQVVDALATFGCFDAHYPALTPDLRAAFFDGAVKKLFALPDDAKRRNTCSPDRPLFGYLGSMAGFTNAYESLAISDRVEPERVRAFADLMWPGGDNAAFCEAVHGAARRIAELEESVQRMVMEGLGVPEYHDAMRESMRHVFRMAHYNAPGGDAEGKEVRYGTHQDCSMLTVVCQHAVDGLEVQTGDGEWIHFRPSSPASLVVIAGNELRAWTNDRVRAPFHRVTVGGDVARYSAILFALPGLKIQAPDELVDEEHPPRFKPHCNDDFMHFCVAHGARHEDRLKDFCGV
ncbi:hypothetical protein SEVIR_9G144400v4 [Setaria viridis]|uniref:2-oxoglutarate-dependent dioxygenase DAO n=1 Tax=Setaria viridis TaxID=4556 RepID=A0A4U6SVQ5_SETVI|nr:probable 2-oxoglutarate-dependent dioxygenase AOP1 [Setaria viridis]TKV92143.1 hypothetical protein SEVIR_9G144400v2 [Setaria viridis]